MNEATASTKFVTEFVSFIYLSDDCPRYDKIITD